jgi:phosphoribosylformylglycinamidine cyclo-ligase
MRMTYAKAGVNIDRKSAAIASLVKTLGYRRKGRGAMLDIEGHFTGLIDFGDYALSLCTDGVGTKLLVADAMDKWDTIGIDCMAMNVNDMICVGAEPLAFVDYIALDEPDEKKTRQVGVGLDKGAELANVTIIGGEIAVLPELVRGFDLAGTCLGAVKKDRIITGAAIKPGDAIIGVRSSGVHSNGLTLARKIVNKAGLGFQSEEPKLGRRWGEELLEPTEIYVRGIMAAVAKHEIHGMANITGGGLRNLIRLKKGLEYRIEERQAPHEVFSLLQELGNVEDREMYQTFNMGMGYAIIAPEGEAKGIIQTIKRSGHASKVVGSVARSKATKATLPELGLSYDKY